jgi:hypothetical protein
MMARQAWPVERGDVCENLARRNCGLMNRIGSIEARKFKAG